MVASIDVFTPHQSSKFSLQTPLAPQVKLEPCMKVITILSDDSIVNSPKQLESSKIPSIESTLPSSSAYSGSLSANMFAGS